MKSKPLGKGIQALFEESSLSEYIEGESKFLELPVDKIRPNPFQPRESFNPEEFEALKSSISQNGLIQPIAVRIVDDGYELVAGERRWKALKELKKPTIPVYLLNIKDNKSLLQISMLENIHRSDLNPIEIATGYQRLNDVFGLTQQQISETFSVDRSTVANMMRLLRLPDKIKDSVKSLEISIGHARALLSLNTEKEQNGLWKRIINEKLSVRQVENIIKPEIKKGSVKKNPPPLKNQTIVQLEDRLRYALGSQVRIKSTKNGGKIEIDFYSNEDLDRLMELFAIIENKY